MLDVFFTVDVEIWCDGWDDIDRKFPTSFRQYVYGRTAEGDYGLPFKIRMLNDHGLLGVFFVEPLFATRFGTEPLAEIVGLLQEGGQEVQLHLHPEWVDEATAPLLETRYPKRPRLRDFSEAEQTTLIGIGARLLRDSGVSKIDAFRAGSFAFNRDTLRALHANGIGLDSSYNACKFGLTSDVMPGVTLVNPVECEGVYEYPMAVYRDGTRSLRHAQLAACTHREMEGLLWQALERGWDSFVILSHNFELMNRAKDRPDAVMVRRFCDLCTFLDRNRDCFNVRGFDGLDPKPATAVIEPLESPIWRTGARLIQQVYRRRYG